MLDYSNIHSWAFKEAQSILDRINHSVPQKGYVLFETGYGPSGLPHIGTFGEVVRTTMVMKAFKYLSDIPIKLFCFSDDMDALRKVPDNIIDKEKYYQYIGLPLTSVPDPFGMYQSYGEYMNVQLIKFLDNFNFKYEFLSATQCYRSGQFNDYLIKVLENYDAIMEIMIPTLGKDRQKTYSPFLPICQNTGRVQQVKIIDKDIKSHRIVYNNEDGKAISISILDGNCKLQWKADFAMRWAAFNVDYEIYGKDIQANAKIYNKICILLGQKYPHQMSYELFLDENGQKISKSKGNGLSIDSWLKYSNQESLKLLMYQSPQKAKKISYEMIPKIFDEHLLYLDRYNQETDINSKLSNPIFFIYNCEVPVIHLGNINFSLLLNLINACNTDNKDILWGYIKNFNQCIDSSTYDYIDLMLGYAINYFHDFVKLKKHYKIPNQKEIESLSHLLHSLNKVSNNAEDIQNAVYKVSKDHSIPLKQWFKLLYEVLLGTTVGPRIGTFIQLYGLNEIKILIAKKISDHSCL